MRIVPAAMMVAAILPGTLAARDTTTVEQALAGRTAGPPRSCIPEPQIDDTRTFASGAILYRMKIGPDYLNKPSGCGGILRGDSVIASRTPSTSLCRGDIVQVSDRISRAEYGSCGLGDFIPYARAGKPKP
jgi:hypothetical protein